MTTLEIKLASLVVHLVEFQSCGGDRLDIAAARDLVNDVEVSDILKPGALIPVTRSGQSVLELLNPDSLSEGL